MKAKAVSQRKALMTGLLCLEAVCILISLIAGANIQTLARVFQTPGALGIYLISWDVVLWSMIGLIFLSASRAPVNWRNAGILFSLMLMTTGLNVLLKFVNRSHQSMSYFTPSKAPTGGFPLRDWVILALFMSAIVRLALNYSKYNALIGGGRQSQSKQSDKPQELSQSGVPVANRDFRQDDTAQEEDNN